MVTFVWVFLETKLLKCEKVSVKQKQKQTKKLRFLCVSAGASRRFTMYYIKLL